MVSNRPFHRVVPLSMFLVLVGFLLAAPAFAQAKSSAAPKHTATAKPMAHAAVKYQYLVISPHAPDQCLAALDAVMAMPNGKAELAKWDWGCKSGDHTGYLMVMASSAEEALKNVPESLRADAKAIKLDKFTPQQIKSLHETMK